MVKKEFKFNTGDKVHDCITGYKGTIVSICTHLTGVDQYLIASGTNKDKNKYEEIWFDEERVKAD